MHVIYLDLSNIYDPYILHIWLIFIYESYMRINRSYMTHMCHICSYMVNYYMFVIYFDFSNIYDP